MMNLTTKDDVRSIDGARITLLAGLVARLWQDDHGLQRTTHASDICALRKVAGAAGAHDAALGMRTVTRDSPIGRHAAHVSRCTGTASRNYLNHVCWTVASSDHGAL